MAFLYLNLVNVTPILQHLRSNFDAIAKKVGDTASYPGDWLYETWLESGTSS